MKKLLLFLLLTLSLYPQNYSGSYYEVNDFAFTSPGAMKFGLYGFDNPASLAMVTAPDFLINWTSYKKKWSDMRRVGVFAGREGFGFAMNHQKVFGASIFDYRLSFAGGTDELSFGMGYGWSNGDRNFFNRSSVWTTGFLFRPSAYISVGTSVYIPAESETQSLVELAARPFGNEKVSLFGDYLIKENYFTNQSKWSAGIAVEALPGFRLTGRYFDNKSFTAGVQVELGSSGLYSQSHFNTNGDYAFNSYGIRFGAYDRNIFSMFDKPQAYYYMNMAGGIKYQRFRFFDNSNTLTDFIENLEHAKNDPAVKGVVVNTVNLNAGKVMLWEVREKLRELKEAGKKVIVYIEDASLELYRFASIADEIYMEPMGNITFEGYMLGRSYLKGTLEKLGIGFDEWRFFKYKSAMEGFSLEKMSPADREQRQALVDDWYADTKDDIMKARGLSSDQYENLINNVFLVSAEQALELKLIDKSARWDSVKTALTKDGDFFVGNGQLKGNKEPKDNQWGKKPSIAVIYAIGACAMDEGIKARTLVNYVNYAVNSPDIKAIVLRVDSPGGDGMASDYVAEALKKAKGKKPVIISQGTVAASGGYWLSMYADTIVAAPGTITGSIGVIGGWFYNKSLFQDAGLSLDHVKKGDHADLGFGFTFPIINFPLAQRAMTSEEKTEVEKWIRFHYKEFVTKVAAGRNSTFDKIHAIGEGRVWTGTDGLGNGLVDVLGGLETAITIAADKAGLRKNEYTLIELPEAPLFNIDAFMPKLISEQIFTDPALQEARFRAKFNGKALYMIPFEYTPDINYNELVP